MHGDCEGRVAVEVFSALVEKGGRNGLTRRLFLVVRSESGEQTMEKESTSFVKDLARIISRYNLDRRLVYPCGVSKKLKGIEIKNSL